MGRNRLRFMAKPFLVVSVLLAFVPDAAIAAPERFAGRLPCSDAASVLRNGVFSLEVGDVRLENGTGCVRYDSPRFELRGR